MIDYKLGVTFNEGSRTAYVYTLFANIVKLYYLADSFY